MLAIIVAFGKPVLSRDKWHLPRPDKSKDIVRHHAAMLTAHLLVCSPEFQEKHKTVYKVFKSCADAKGSKWVLRDDMSEAEAARSTKGGSNKSRKPVHLRNIADAFAFLHKVRRVERTRNLGGSYCAKPSCDSRPVGLAAC